MNKAIKKWLTKYPDSTPSEMRAIRREFINGYLHKGYKTLSIIKMLVRFEEGRFGMELKYYGK